MIDTKQYLSPTSLIDSDSEVIKEAVNECTRGMDAEKDKAVAIFYYVRDKIKFGLMANHDMAKASYTLEKGMGHCNPNTHVFVAMLRACGIPARVHFVTHVCDNFRIWHPPLMPLEVGAECGNCLRHGSVLNPEVDAISGNTRPRHA